MLLPGRGFAVGGDRQAGRHARPAAARERERTVLSGGRASLARFHGKAPGFPIKFQ